MEKNSMSMDVFEAQFIKKGFGYEEVKELVSPAQSEQVSSFWYAAKALESDENVMGILKKKLSSDKYTKLESKVKSIEDSALTFNAKSGIDTSVMSTLPQFFTKAEMLAFLFAVSFNMPCVMAMSTTYKENHSKKWTAIIACYYTAFSLVLAFIAYHVGILIF